MNSLSINIRKKTSNGGVGEVVVQLAGTLDQSVASALMKQVAPLVYASPSQLVIDITALRHMSADGIRLLEKLLTMQEQHGGQLSLVNFSSQLDDAQLRIREFDNGVKLILLAGNLDLRGTQAVESGLQSLSEGDKPRLLVDLSAADMIVSLGIRMLLQAIKTASAHGGRVLLLNPSPAVSSALEFSGLAQFIARGKDAEVAAGLGKI